MSKEWILSIARSVVVLSTCLSVSHHTLAEQTQPPMDRNLVEGVFVGKANRAEPTVEERLEMYEGPLPKDRGGIQCREFCRRGQPRRQAVDAAAVAKLRGRAYSMVPLLKA